MSRKYKLHNPKGIYFVSFALIHCLPALKLQQAGMEMQLKFFKIVIKAIMVILTIITLSSCKDPINTVHSVNTNDWKCSKTPRFLICCPPDWKILKQNKILFYAYIDSPDLSTYFSIINYDVDSNAILINYLKEAYKQIKIDTIEILKKIIATEIVYKDKKAIYVEVHSKKQENTFIYYAVYTMDSSYLYDFTIKINERQRKDYYSEFSAILFNFKVDDNFLFNKIDTPLSITEINEQLYQ